MARTHFGRFQFSGDLMPGRSDQVRLVIIEASNACLRVWLLLVGWQRQYGRQIIKRKHPGVLTY